MKILYLGNFRAPWCTEVHIARDLEALGHTVYRLQEPPGGGTRRTLESIESHSRGTDLVLWTRTWGLPPEATELWRRLEQRGVVTASYHLDLYVGLERQQAVAHDPFWTTGHVFTPDGDPASAAWFAEQGINHHWMPPAVVSDECTPGVPRRRFDFDVVFVGSEGYHREWPWRGEVLSWLAARYGARFRRFGGDQPEGPTRGSALNDLYATAKVVVGDSLCLPGHTRYWSDRYYETVGRGGFLIGPRVPGIEEHFTDGEHLVLYDHGDLDGLGVLIDKWLPDTDGRYCIQARGQDHVRSHHTYRHRLGAALEIMFGPRAPIRLELGSGYSPTPGFTHLDLNPNAPDVDIVGSAFPLDLPDGCCFEVRAVDVLEHLSYWDTAAALAEWARVLAPGGRLYVQVPDAELVMRWYSNDPDRLVERLPQGLPRTPLAGAAWRLLGGHRDGVQAKDGDDWRLNAHYALFSRDSLTKALVSAGLSIESIETNDHPNLCCWAVKP